MNWLINFINRFIGSGQLSTKTKTRTLCGKHLKIWVGETSADDEDGDCDGYYKIISGKVQRKVLKREYWGDKVDFRRWKQILITPISRTAVIKYTYHAGAGSLPSKITRIRLFKDFHHKRKTVDLGKF